MAYTPAGGLDSFLLSGRNQDGGWAYHRGKATRLEPTCWALLALGKRAADAKVLESWPARAGLLLERADGSPNYAFHALALLTMRALNVEHTLGAPAVIDALQAVRSEELPPSTINSQDNSLRAWSWIERTFSWVEPTAWSLLALKKWARAPGVHIDTERIDIGERLLVNRCCTTGGWNYGNSNMLGQQLKAFVPTTAIALLALQDRPSLPEVERSVAFLEENATAERSGQALSLALMALAAFDRPLTAVREALAAQLPTTLAFGNQMSVAMAMYSMETSTPDAVLL